MISPKHPSIRRYLLKRILLALVVASCVIAVSGYLTAKHELDELYNENLSQVAQVIADHYRATGRWSSDELFTTDNLEQKITREEQFFIRITDKDEHILYISHPAITVPHAVKPGYSTLFAVGKNWRIYLNNLPDGKIEVAQYMPLRSQAIRQVALSIIIPQICFVPLLIIFIWIMIGRSLKFLSNISDLINQQSVKALQPLPIESAPIEILPLVNALNALLARLGEMVTTLKHFTSDAAHELRTPLTALKLQVALVERASNPGQQSQALADLKNGIDNVINIVQQLLTLARAEPHNYLPTFDAIDLNEIVKRVMAMHLAMAAEKQIDLGTQQQDPVLIAGDTEEISILLRNLIDNAIRYTPEGGRVDVNIHDSIDAVELEVIDTGCNIQEHDESRIFDRFYRGKNSTNQNGTGLGLAIVKEIADRHNATILLNRTGKYLSGLQIILHFPKIAAK